jgi:gas vesicle protein
MEDSNMHNHTKRSIWFGVGGLIIGATAGVLLAPQSGRHTRALIRDKTIRYSHETARFADKKARHVANKMRGYAHDVKHVIVRRKEVPEVEEIASV